MERVIRESQLLPRLQELEDKYGYLPEGELEELSRKLKIPISRIYGVATFYSRFSLTPSGKNLIMLCRGTACHVRGGARVLRIVKEKLGINEGETTPDGKFTLKTVACIGACAQAPTMMIGKQAYGKLTPEKAIRIILSHQK